MQMLERICRTLVSASGGAPDEITDGIPAWQKVQYLGRAVLEEMREPDRAMLSVGIDHMDEAMAFLGCYSTDDDWTEKQVRQLQSAVISAALNE